MNKPDSGRQSLVNLQGAQIQLHLLQWDQKVAADPASSCPVPAIDPQSP